MPSGLTGIEAINRNVGIADVLLARAVASPVPPTEQSPVATGDFYLGAAALESLVIVEPSPAVTVISDHLPSIESQTRTFEEMQDMEMLGELMYRARLSALTGCLMRDDLWRNHNFYAKVKSRAAKEIGLGTFRDIHRVAHFLYKTEKTGELPDPKELSKKVDHICRNPSCFHPNHTRLMGDRENNQLKDKAARLEPKIIHGQLFYMRDLLKDLPWLEHTVVHEGEELPAQVISTRLGPFALRYSGPHESVVYGVRLACDIYDSLRTPAKNTYVAPSRAKKFTPIEDHTDLFPPEQFKEQPVSAKDLYEASLKA